MRYNQYNYSSVLLSILGLFSWIQYANAGTINIRISESSESDETYISGENHQTLNPTSKEDAKKLGQSVEFEVVKMNESSSSRTVFESPAGICYGYKDSPNGVTYTNSVQNYISHNNKDEYYGSVSGATLYKQDDSKNLRYVPVYAINNQALSREIQKRQGREMHEKAMTNIDNGKVILNNVICK